MGIFKKLESALGINVRANVIEEIKKTGFKATQKKRIGPLLFAIDENLQYWLVMDDRNPRYTPIHTFSQIKSAKIIQETQTVSNRTGASSRIGRVRLSSGQRVTHKVYTKLGVLVVLDDLKFPTQYIDCLPMPGVEDTILSMVETMKRRGGSNSVPVAQLSGLQMETIRKLIETTPRETTSRETVPAEDELIPAAIEVVVEAGMASTSLLQRRLKIGYARASRLIDEMERMRIVGPFEGSIPRQVLISKEQYFFMMDRGDFAPKENSSGPELC